MKILVTGGCGFIGSNFIHYMLGEYSDCHIINLDALTYAGNPENLKKLEGNKRYHFIKGDINNITALCSEHSGLKDPDAVVNFAAESHVDRSIESSFEFIRTNINGTMELLEFAKSKKIPMFLQISTDEVYGTLGDTGKFTETTPLDPSSPYSSSKAGADLLAIAYHRTHKIPVKITRCSNNYGPYQFPEKLIPLMITNCMEGKKLPVYGTGKNVRDWIHVLDHCKGIDTVLRKGKVGEVYNLGGNSEKNNIDVVKKIVQITGASSDLISYVTDRKGHDWRYAIDCGKIKAELGWEPQIGFEEGIKDTVKWYMENKEWWKPLKQRLGY
jgi:dTDP-glucose 4,6-dehydratase